MLVIIETFSLPNWNAVVTCQLNRFNDIHCFVLFIKIAQSCFTLLVVVREASMYIFRALKWLFETVLWVALYPWKKTATPPTRPESVNYHFTRQCNYQCGFCFHTAKTSFVLPLDDAKRGLMLLKEAGKSQ